MRERNMPEAASLQRAATAASVSLAGYANYVLATLLLHLVRPELNPLAHSVSEYAVGRYGWLMTTGFLGFALGSLALAAGLYWGVPRAGRSLPGLVLLGLNGVGVVVVALFRTDLPGAAPTAAGLIHVAASLVAFPSLVLAIGLLSWKCRRAEVWREYFPLAWRLTWLVVPLFVAYFFGATSPLVGLLQRLFIASTLAWLALTAARLRADRQRANAPVSAPAPRG